MAKETEQEKVERELRENAERERKAADARAEIEAEARKEKAERERIKREADKIKGDYKMYDIKNPTIAPRVIYDGIPGSMAMHSIPARGGQKRGVKLHDDIVLELQLRNEAKPNSDLIVTPHEEAA